MTGTRYIIKVTHLEGKHAGEYYYQQKGGWITELNDVHFDDTTYETEGIAKRVCARLYRENEASREIERQDEAIRIKRGKAPKGYWIYEHDSFEPVAVEAIIY